jgi:hypothetical protein
VRFPHSHRYSPKRPSLYKNVSLRTCTVHLLSIFGSYLFTLSGLTARAIPTAAVERAPFHRARSGSKGMPWL